MWTRQAQSTLLLCVLLLCSRSVAASGLILYVSPDGNDAWDGAARTHQGTSHGPVHSLDRARNLVQMLRKKWPGLTTPIRVQLAPGTYGLDDTLRLSQEDSGTPESPTLYQSETPGTAILRGDIPLPAAGWTKPGADCAPCQAHPAIRRYLLPRNVVAASGELVEEGFGRDAPFLASELLMDGNRLPLARWPDTGFAALQDADSTGAARLQAPQPLPAGIGAASTLWARGFWKYDWADISIPIASIDARNGWMTLQRPIQPYGVAKGARFYLFNALALLDQPGEWFLNRSSGELYFYAPPDLAAHRVTWPVLENIVSLEGVRHLRFEGLTFMASRGDAIVARDVDAVAFTACRIQGAGGWAADIAGHDSGLEQCELSQLGAGGVRLRGGDRASLSPGGLYVTRSRIHDFSMRAYTMHPALSLEGVGARAAGNVITHGPHMAILLAGNNHLVEDNDISGVVSQTSDAGAIYIGRDWTARGTIIRRNYLHDIQPLPHFETKGIYLDDQASGIEIRDNVFWNVMQPVFIGGGSDNLVRGNIFVASSPAISFDSRGLGWQRQYSQDPSGTLQRRLRDVPFDTAAVWKKSFPALLNIRTDGYGRPMRNQFSGNAFLASTPYHLAVGKTVPADQVMQAAVKTDAAGTALQPEDAPADRESLCRRLQASGIGGNICRHAPEAGGN